MLQQTNRLGNVCRNKLGVVVVVGVGVGVGWDWGWQGGAWVGWGGGVLKLHVLFFFFLCVFFFFFFFFYATPIYRYMCVFDPLMGTISKQ